MNRGAIDADGVHRRTSSPTTACARGLRERQERTDHLHDLGNGNGDTPHSAHDHDHDDDHDHANPHAPLRTRPPPRPLSSPVSAAEAPIPAAYLTKVLGFQLVCRLLALAVYLADVCWWYQRPSRYYMSYLSYLTYWIPFHYAALLAIKNGAGMHAGAVVCALLTHTLEAFTLISTVFKHDGYGAEKLRYLVWPTATQGIANALMTIFAFAVVLNRRRLGQQYIHLSDITAPALLAADISFVVSLLSVPYVPFVADLPRHKVIALTALFNVVTLHLRHSTFTRSFNNISYLPNHTLFAAITLGEARLKGNELKRKLNIDIPGLNEEEMPKPTDDDDDARFLQRVYLLHFVRLAVTFLVWDTMLTSTSITAVVASHPYLAGIGFAALYTAAPAFLARARKRSLLATGSAVLAVDALRGMCLASVGGLVRWMINVLNFGVSASEREHVEAHAHLLTLLPMLILLGARAGLTLTFISSSPRSRSARGALVALLLAGFVVTYMASRLNLSISLSGLLPYSYTHDSPVTGSSSALFALLAVGLLVSAYMCVQEVWDANRGGGAVSRLPNHEVLLGTILLQGSERKYDKLRQRDDLRDLPLLAAVGERKFPLSLSPV